jgi:DNA gyrase subunit A
VNNLIYETDFQKQIENAFLTYGASVAQERAIPDVRDMLKIGLRQGLYAQFTNKLTHKDKMQKAQKSVAAAMAQSYVHGDVAMYDTFIRAARPWSYRYPVEDVQGSFGNPSSPDSHAAARYVEMRAGEMADFFFAGLKKNAIGEQWYSNYDDTELIPSVFPSIGFWNIVNGCSGIAVAMATSVPQFNLKEVNEALIKIIQNPNVDFNDIYCAPDFATGATIINARAVKESLRYGKGESVRLQATLTYHPDQNMIQATNLPHGVFTNTIIDQLAGLTEENPDYGIEKVVDHTKKVADIRIYLTKGINPKKMIAKLYKDTSLENWFSINMILLDKGRFPKVFGWREACDAYIEHIRQCERNIIQFDLDKALARKNIVDGLIKAYSIIDEVVALIRSSSNPAEAAKKLISTYAFNEEQAKAILAMKLSSLTKLDIVKLNEELEELIQKIAEYQHLLNDTTALDNELIKILENVATKYGDERRTKVLNLVEPNEDEVEATQEEEIGLMLFDNNMLRLIKKDDLQGGKRGRKGVNIKPPKNANLINTLYTTNLSTVAAFTNLGRMYNFSLNELDYDKDYSIYELIIPQDKEKVILLTDTTSFNAYKNIITVSKNGYIKKSSVSEYNVRAKKGTAAVKLEENDFLIGVYLSMDDEDKMFIASSAGTYNFYKLKELSNTGRTTKGVKAIKLLANETIKSATIIKKDINYRGILTITTGGKGKITAVEDFNETSRAIRGSQVMATKDEELAVVYAVPELQNKLFISANNKAVLLDINTIPIQGRATTGVKIIDAHTDKIEIM